MTISVFTNIPNPYNDRLFASLRAAGATVRVTYKRAPADEGRSWPLALPDGERIASTLVDEARAWRDAAGTDVILTGSYATAVDAARRVLSSPRARSVHVWGERLQQNNAAVRLVRRTYFAPARLDGILAVGTRAVPTYLEVLPAKRVADGSAPPVHTFPYTTDRGLHVPPTPSPEPTIGFAGRLLPYKGVDVLVRAVAAMPRATRPRLDVAGDGPALGALQAQARALGVDDVVRWLGALTPDELDARRATWWLQAVPSQRSEGWGVVVHEALNSGVPVVASDHVHAAADLVRDGDDGVIIDVASAAEPDAWATAIAAVLDDGPWRAALRGRGRVVGAAFACDHAAAFLLEVLADATRGRARGAVARSFIDEGWQHIDAEATR